MIQAPPNIVGDVHDEQNSESLATNAQQHGNTVYAAEEGSPSSDRPTSRSSDISIRSMNSSTLRPQVGNSRVKKRLVVAPSPQLQKPGATSTPSRVPTEEDLLLLLMRRQRIRDHAYNRLLNDLHQLQAENQQLQNEGHNRDAELVDVKSKWHDALRESHIREADIRAFGDKYDKLKAWARDMHDAFASTRAEGGRLNDEVSRLRAEKEAQTSEMNELLEKVKGISEPMRKFKETIADLRTTSIELQTTQDLLEQARKDLQDEKSANKAHILRIEKLESDQQSMNFRFLKQQDEMQNSLSLVSGLLQKNDNGFLHKVVAELTNSMQGLQRDIATKAESSAQFSSLLDATEQSHARLSTAMNRIIHAQLENQIIQNLSNEMAQLKENHAAELANHSGQAQEAAAKLAKAYNDIEKERAKSEEAQSKTVETEERLANFKARFEQTNNCLSTKRRHAEQLQEEKEKLEKKNSDVSDLNQGLKAKVEQLEADNKTLQETRNCEAELLNTHKTRTSDLEQDVKTHLAKIKEQVAKITTLETTCEKHEITEADLRRKLEDAHGKIADLESTTKTNDSRLQTLQKDFDDARKAQSEVSNLEEVVKTEEAKVHKLSKDLDDCHAEIEIKKADLLKQNLQIDNLQKDKSKIDNELKALAAAHEQCGNKDASIDALKAENDDLVEKMQPLSTLLKLLTKEEQMALNEKVVLTIKATIQRLQGQDRDSSIGDNEALPRPRRAANRDNNIYDEDMVVQETQSQDLSKNTEGWDDFLNDDDDTRSSSSLSEPDMTIDLGPVSKLYDTVISEELRPATSNDEMLLRSSDIGIYPRTQTQATILVPASSNNEISPMRTRQGSQIRHGTPNPRTSADGERVVNFSTPPTHPREAHPPNSAAKRRQTSEVPESAAKRRAVNMKNLEVQSSKNSTVPSSTQSSDSDGLCDFPVSGRKGMGISTSKMGAPHQQLKKKATSSRKNSKSAKMEAQFNAHTL